VGKNSINVITKQRVVDTNLG